jgi:hypothetical protein
MREWWIIWVMSFENLGFVESRGVDRMGRRFGESRARWLEWVSGLYGG